MRIVIDLQGAQALGSKHRGIGRYSLALAQHIAMRGQDRHHIQIALNGGFADSIEEIVQHFKGVVDRKDIKVWHPGVDRGFAGASPAAMSAAGKLYETFLYGLRPDIVHVSSLFEGLGDCTITSIGTFAPLRTSVTLYDLIPLINSDPYLNDPVIKRWYMDKIGSLRRADLWLAISESSRQEGLDHLNLDPERCVNVSTAAGGHFRPVSLAEDRERQLRSKYGLNRKFIMYTGGIDLRKNLDGLIRAFAHLPEHLRQSHQVAIVCSAREHDRAHLLDLARDQGISPNSVVITGFVPEEDLVDLYNLCDLFVFPSWHEGFGLPALEAMMCGAPVIASNSSSLPEVVGRSEVLFDARNDRAICDKMTQVLSDESMRRRIAEEGLAQSRRFSWDESARRAIEAFERLVDHSDRQTSVAPAIRALGKPTLAYVSPLPPERTGIANYSAELLPSLAKFFDITLITSLPHEAESDVSTGLPCKDVDWLRSNAARFDHVLYHFGNSQFHLHMFGLLEEVPGAVVLHDFFLSGVQAHREFVGREFGSWSRALYDSHGYAALRHRFRTQNLAETVNMFPCNFDVLRAARGVIVHSPYSGVLAKEWYGRQISENWALVPLARALPAISADRRNDARKKLGFGPDEFVVCSFGIINPTKLNHRLLHAWTASSLAKRPGCRLVFVGQNDEGPFGETLMAEIAKLPRPSSVHITGWTDDALFQQYLDAADAAVQLRTLSRGETSAAVLDALGRGLPTIVNANGSMQYLPEDAVLRIPDQFSDQQLVDALERLMNDPSMRDMLRRNARTLIEKEHSPAACAQLYADALTNFAAAESYRRPGLLGELQRSGLDASMSELSTLAVAIAQSLPLLKPACRLFVDIGDTTSDACSSAHSEEARGLVSKILGTTFTGYRVEPVRLSQDSGQFLYARALALELLDVPRCLPDEPVDFGEGDIYLGVGLPASALKQRVQPLSLLKQHGVLLHLLFVGDPSKGLHTAAPQSDEEDNQALGTVVALIDGFFCMAGVASSDIIEWGTRHGLSEAVNDQITIVENDSDLVRMLTVDGGIAE